MVSLTVQGDKGTGDGKKTDELMMKTHTHIHTGEGYEHVWDPKKRKRNPLMQDVGKEYFLREADSKMEVRGRSAAP